MSTKYEIARRRAQEKIKFYKHLRSFITVNLCFFLLFFISGNGFGWFKVTWMWGIGLFAHYLSVFGMPGTNGMFSKGWEEDLMEKELESLNEDDFEELDLRETRKVKQERWSEKDLV